MTFKQRVQWEVPIPSTSYASLTFQPIQCIYCHRNGGVLALLVFGQRPVGRSDKQHLNEQ
jgi:hypothetical protein